jgi:cation diffusion facilitator family transporter
MGGMHGFGRRVAITSIVVSSSLAVSKIFIGLLAHSTAVVADGLESVGDVMASTIVFFGLAVAARPPDANHPYGHGRFEILTALVVGMILTATGTGICLKSLDRVSEVHPPPASYAVWPLIGSIALKGLMSTFKFRYGRRLASASLVADAWNDLVDILSGTTALVAVGLTLYNPQRFLAADHYGGFAVGLIVIFTGLRVMRETTLQLMDTMPDPVRMAEIRRVALSIPGVLGVEKCFARKTGLQHHVDLHLEVDPGMTVRASHDLATRVRIEITEQLSWVADVLVHVEPFSTLESAQQSPANSGSRRRLLR